MARRLGHGETITAGQFQEARDRLAASVNRVPLAFAAAQPADLKDFDFLFPRLQNNPKNLLPEDPSTPSKLARLGRTMIDLAGNDPAGDSRISALMTYFGQFIDHDITLEMASADLKQLTSPGLKPLPLDDIRHNLRNARTATLDLDSLYDLPAPRVGDRMLVGKVSRTWTRKIPFKRPAGKDIYNDLPREPRSDDPAADRAARIGDPRNDENLIVAQLHLAFLRAHNAIVGRGHKFTEARRLLRQHYQHLVIHDFLMQVCDPKIVRGILKSGGKFYDATAEPFFMPLEFSAAAFRFGHTMVRLDYDFNVNFNTKGAPAMPATVDLLFTFTALTGQLGGSDTLPENWIIEWEDFVGKGQKRNRARLFDTKLANPLFKLMNSLGKRESGLGAILSTRNLLRGYLLRMPTGQSVARAMGLEPLTAAQLCAVAAGVPRAPRGERQVDALRACGFSRRTPLWYYVLAEAAHHHGGRHLGPVGSTIVAEVLIGLILRSEDSILRAKNWKPTLGSKPKQFTIEDLLKLAGVL